MGMVNFYHLTRHSLDDTVRMVVNRAQAQGWRVMIRSADRAALDRLDAQLWLTPDDSFVPHALSGGPHDADQPVLLGPGPAVNGAQGVLLLGDQAIDAAEAQAIDRVWLVFEGADDGQMQSARTQWKAVTAAGLTAQYWADASGRWEKKAESARPSG